MEFWTVPLGMIRWFYIYMCQVCKNPYTQTLKEAMMSNMERRFLNYASRLGILQWLSIYEYKNLIPKPWNKQWCPMDASELCLQIWHTLLLYMVMMQQNQTDETRDYSWKRILSELRSTTPLYSGMYGLRMSDIRLVSAFSSLTVCFFNMVPNSPAWKLPETHNIERNSDLVTMFDSKGIIIEDNELSAQSCNYYEID